MQQVWLRGKEKIYLFWRGKLIFHTLYNDKENLFLDNDYNETSDILNSIRFSDELSAFNSLKYLNLEQKRYYNYDVVKIKFTIEMEDV